jgi:hypothetical protein
MLDAATRETEASARKWLGRQLGLDMDAPIFPFQEREERRLGNSWRKLNFRNLMNGIAAALVLIGMGLRFLAPQEIGDLIGASLALIAIINFGQYWDLRRCMDRASKLDHAFFQTVCAGESDLSLWPPFEASKHHVEIAQSISQQALKDAQRRNEQA